MNNYKSIIGKSNRIEEEITPFEDVEARILSYKESDVRPQTTIPTINQKIKPVQDISGIVKSDYIKIPGCNFVTAIAETNPSYGYFEAHREVLAKGLSMHTPYEFMKFRNYIVESYYEKSTIFDAAENPIPENVKNDIYRQIMFDSKTWLNAQFTIIKGTLMFKGTNLIENITGFHTDKNSHLSPHTELLDKCLMKNGYIDFYKFTKQGLPSVNSWSNIQAPSSDENIYYKYPRSHKVAVFSATKITAMLDCNHELNLESTISVRTKLQLSNISNNTNQQIIFSGDEN
jgi:hypothetical protein